jgi:hypothetical protein
MSKPRLILCSGARSTVESPLSDAITMELESHGRKPNVYINLMNVAKVFAHQLNPRLIDLLEIAAYIYSADCGVARGKGWDDGHSTERWSRKSHFVIPVRDKVFWDRDDVKTLLSEILQFIADDNVTFEFPKAHWKDQEQLYLEYGDNEDWQCYGLERVIMFSGGLDSLSGAVKTAASDASDGMVLVSHRPVSTLDSRQRKLVQELGKKFPIPLTHVPVWVNKHRLGQESTQRTRSFLFAAIGTTVAEGVKAEGVRFFENGVVSLNLPVADEVIRSRASRTTHPVSLELFTEFFSLLTERSLVFDNPYIHMTKTEVVSVLDKFGAAELIGHSCSCSHPMFKSKSQLHCGTCSQCIDRRIAVLAADLAGYDSADDYEVNVFTGPRKQGYEKNMAVNYARHAVELSKMSDTAMLARFNMEIARAVRPEPKPSKAAESFINMFRRHGEVVTKVLREQLRKHSTDMIDGTLDDNCMLSLIASKQHATSSWTHFADRITEMLRAGLPTACKSVKPKNEPHLQEICDGILKAQDIELRREYPFMPWSSSLTKPDWSAEHLRLWVELKYVRKTSGIRPITEDIAADITKYGDNERRILFVVYDPDHLVTDEETFSKEIVKRDTMFVRFVR